MALAVVPVPSAVAQTVLSANGVVESKSGGFRFPDGSVQEAAAVPFGTCPTMEPSDEMIWVGGVCMDKYEASIWNALVGGTQITGEIPCNDNGQDCSGVIYARSVAGVQPRTNITWFQAQAALANSGKRLPTNAEWQMVVLGTPDDLNCNIDSSAPANTGSFGNCFSAWGAFDMVGNVGEWVGDWIPRATCTSTWPSGYGGDRQEICGAATSGPPGAMIRGGSHALGTNPGPFAVFAGFGPSYTGDAGLGFRGAR